MTSAFPGMRIAGDPEFESTPRADRRCLLGSTAAITRTAWVRLRGQLRRDVRNAGYIASWIELLKADKRAFFTACSKAQAAADYLRQLALASPAEVAA